MNALSKAPTISMLFNNVATDITVFARRGAVLYGVCRTPLNSVVLVELLQIDAPSFDPTPTYERKVVSQITFLETQGNKLTIENNVKVTVSCFAGNAGLTKQFPDLQAQLCTKILQLIDEIPAAEVYVF